MFAIVETTYPIFWNCPSELFQTYLIFCTFMYLTYKRKILRKSLVWGSADIQCLMANEAFVEAKIEPYYGYLRFYIFITCPILSDYTMAFFIRSHHSINLNLGPIIWISIWIELRLCIPLPYNLTMKEKILQSKENYTISSNINKWKKQK